MAAAGGLSYHGGRRKKMRRLPRVGRHDSGARDAPLLAAAEAEDAVISAPSDASDGSEVDDGDDRCVALEKVASTPGDNIESQQRAKHQLGCRSHSVDSMRCPGSYDGLDGEAQDGAEAEGSCRGVECRTGPPGRVLRRGASWSDHESFHERPVTASFGTGGARVTADAVPVLVNKSSPLHTSSSEACGGSSARVNKLASAVRSPAGPDGGGDVECARNVWQLKSSPPPLQTIHSEHTDPQPGRGQPPQQDFVGERAEDPSPAPPATALAPGAVVNQSFGLHIGPASDYSGSALTVEALNTSLLGACNSRVDSSDMLPLPRLPDVEAFHDSSDDTPLPGMANDGVARPARHQGAIRPLEARAAAVVTEDDLDEEHREGGFGGYSSSDGFGELWCVHAESGLQTNGSPPTKCTFVALHSIIAPNRGGLGGLTRLLNSDLPHRGSFALDRSQRLARLRAASPFGPQPGWRLCAMIVKADDELLQVGVECSQFAYAELHQQGQLSRPAINISILMPFPPPNAVPLRSNSPFHLSPNLGAFGRTRNCLYGYVHTRFWPRRLQPVSSRWSQTLRV